ncbi:hypothetical protein DFH09DRAFT_1305353 [Mycena vulgaris]|nr:hypothetical protein DFH09DRAFT_1305353 [Mycena vulgaris]
MAQPTVNDSLNYLDIVKAAVSSATYEEFTDLLHKFRIGSLPPADFLARISDLFNGHPTLIAGMNVFDLIVPTPMAQPTVNDSLNYLDTVKAAVSSATYEEFTDLLHKFRIGSLPTADLLARISDLFNGHPTLIAGMNVFVGPDFSIACTADGKVVTVTSPAGATTRTYT